MSKKNYLLVFSLGVLFFFAILPSVFSQSFTRVIELKSPTRMNGQDVLTLQNRLLSLCFDKIGEADGYYGPLAESVIKSIQTFSGFKPDGKVNKMLWDYIFSNNNTKILQDISIISTYNLKGLIKTKELVDSGHEYYISTVVYYSLTDLKAKMLVCEGGAESTDWNITFYYVNDTCYFIDYRGSFEDERMIIFDNGKYSMIVNGELRPNPDMFNFIETQDANKKLLMADFK